ncbi:MAG: DUF4185 domain-containing protein [Tenericutes bacterium]|nr:DUF4185 domain-containing protein [Mycoplasmatota bacterium]
MKKFLVSLLLIVMSFTILSCDASKYVIPDIIGMDINEAKLLIAGEVKTEITYESTNQHLPDLVLGFQDGLEVNDKMNKNKTLNIIVAQAPEGSFTHSNEIEYVYDLGFVTGPDSQNFDLLRETGIGSTDLGIPVTIDDKIVFLYGDTFSGTENMSGIWNSNVMVEFTDTDFSDGITFSRVITNDRGFALAFAQGLHHKSETDEESQSPSREVTKIPTGGIQVGEDVYFFYMSVRYWGSHGDWGVSYNQVVKSDTSLSSFSEVDGLRWTEELAANFGQIFPFENPDQPDYVYFVSIPGGRFGGVALFRVLKTNFENFQSYEYYLGNDNWVSGSNGLQQFKENPHLIISAPCGELSIMYNNYLDKWMIVYLRNGEIIMQTAENLIADWSQPITLVTGSDFNGLYGGFISPDMITDDGKKFYMQVSRWLPIYQTQLVEVVLK